MDEKDKKVLNTFARECFRDVADKDYIVARLHYKLGLIEHFQWSGLQAIEKYLKAILLFNQISTKGLSHKIYDALKRADKKLPFKLDLTDRERLLIKHLQTNGQNRYLERETYSVGNELLDLDKTVWALRKYCKPINYSHPKIKDPLTLELKMINSKQIKENPHRYRLVGGYLERVLKKAHSDEQRRALIWKNRMFGERRKARTFRFPIRSSYVRPPHVRRKEDLDLLQSFVFIPNSEKV